MDNLQLNRAILGQLEKIRSEVDNIGCGVLFIGVMLLVLVIRGC